MHTMNLNPNPNPNPNQEETMQYKYTKSSLNAMRKDKLYELCLRNFGYDTASIYREYTKAEMIDDLALLPRTKSTDTRCLIGIVNHDTQTIAANPCQFMGYPIYMMPKLKTLSPDAIQALAQGNIIASLRKSPPERMDKADLHLLDMTQTPLSLPSWCSYAYVYNPINEDWTVYNAHGNIIHPDALYR